MFGIINRSSGNFDKAIGYFKKNLQIRIQLGQTAGQAKTYINLANVYLDMADYAKAERYYKIGIEKAKETNLYAAEITAQTNLAVVYQNLSDYSKSLDYLFDALQANKQLKDNVQDGYIYVNIGQVYQDQAQNKLAEEYYLKALGIFKTAKRDEMLANIYNNLGIVNRELKNLDRALEFYNQSLRLYKTIGMEPSTFMVLHNIGIVYTSKKEYDKALQYETVALNAALKGQNNDYASRCYMSIADIYTLQGKYAQAKESALKGLALSKDSGDMDELKNSYTTLATVYSASKDYENAFLYQKKIQELSDSLNNDAINKRIGQMQAMYDADKKQNEIDILTKDQELKDAKIVRQRIVNYTAIAGLLLVLVLAFISFRRYREKKKANIEITQQKEIIEEKNKEILDSIHYAKRIQGALLASANTLKNNLPEHFVLYKPKDIVSGDFYWAQKTTDNKFLLATCDCTGHGVPGAFMSLLNISKLNETVNERRITQPDLIFREVRTEIIKALNPDGTDNTARDGMDAVLCLFDFDSLILQFAAANNPLIIIRNDEVIEYKADKFPVGIHQGELKPFRLQTVQLQKGDRVYTFTDGFSDQFGGDKGKKLMSKNFKETLLNGSVHSPEKQKQDLYDLFENWRGTIEQVDDVLVIGIKI
ncbi:MAG: hypothetical protein JWP12_2147 [Bacteroidetes bacterium]|nr:hypothetical protein [Bacteroidota bacterium]